MNMSERNEMLADLKRSGIDINSTSRLDIVEQATNEYGIPLSEILEILESLDRDTVLKAVHEAMIAYNAIVDEEEDEDEILSCVKCGEEEDECTCNESCNGNCGDCDCE